MSYDFSALNDKDLEELALDILAKKFKIDFQSFKMGADKGIDLRYATANDENAIIVQVKHYLYSGITKLKSDLKKKEASKVKALNPKRYILVTSLPLTPVVKEQIKNIFHPFIISTNDILGKNELNYFLRKYKNIEQAHFKLWLSSTNVLDRILRNGVKGRSEFFDHKIQNRIKIFVPNKTHKEAVEILNKYNFILITGAPGIGKSTLANMLTYQLLAQDFELIYVREIIEAEDLNIPGKKQVFYFDDFLGSITLDLKSSKNADSGIVNFIERIKNDKQKRLLLTCRTTILNQAREQSEKLYNSNIEISNYEVKIEDYRDIEKAKILYSHIYFSNLQEDLQSVFFKDHFYWKVIKHPNYNPRIIEFFTDSDRLQPGSEYNKEVMNFLDNPSRIWEKSFNVQISQNARLFLSTLYSLGGKYIVSEKKIKEAFDASLNHEVNKNNYVNGPNTFNSVIRELVGGFIVRTHKIEKKNANVEFRFLNPSIEDFLYYYFSDNIDEYLNILRSAQYFDQFRWRITTKLQKESKRIYFGNKDSSAELLKIFLARVEYLKTNNNKKIETAIVLIELFEWEKIHKQVIEIMDDLNISHLSWDDRDNLIKILAYVAENDLMDNFSFSIKELIEMLSKNMIYHFQIEEFSRFISKEEIYRQVIEESINSDPDYYAEIQSNIDQSWSNSFDYYITQTGNLNTSTRKDDLISLINEKKQAAREINGLLILNSSPIIDEYVFDYDAQLKKNILNNAEKESKINDLQKLNNDVNENLEINRLFNSEDNYELNEVPF